MLNVTLNWTPEPKVLMQLMEVATEDCATLEQVLEDAIELYLEMKLGQPLSVENDPMVGLFSGSPDLSEQTETGFDFESDCGVGVPCQS